MSQTKNFNKNSAIWFVSKPNWLELKYEKALTISIQMNFAIEFLRKFPK